ncbi:MAG: hypothetical protein ACI857_000411 [Arenicella sp.]|jgi:hypothetical protein
MIDFFIKMFSDNPGLIVAGIILGFIGLVSQMSLYAKAGQPAISALVPVWNIMIFCKVVGRPAKHAWFLVVPGLVMLGVVLAYWPIIDGLFPTYSIVPDHVGWTPAVHGLSEAAIPFIIIGVASLPIIYFVIVMFTEVCDSFGKHGTTDKVMCVIFNGFYILFVLGISSAMYEAPWWAKKRGKPYYMPDFKHKGKKYLVTPDGPMIGDPRDQKVKIAMVDINESEEVIEKIAGGADVNEAIKETHANDEKPLKKIAKEVPPNAPAETKKVEPKKVATVANKKAEPKKTSTSKPGAKAESKLKVDGAPMTWREEMTKKYKKKK